MVLLDGQGTSAAIALRGTQRVDCFALDEVLVERDPTFIKMDIEGSECDALLGARRVIEKSAPILAISAYHKQDDLWRVPLLMRSLRPDYQLYLRPHDEVFELVCYAVPPSRRVSTCIATGYETRQ